METPVPLWTHQSCKLWRNPSTQHPAPSTRHSARSPARQHALPPPGALERGEGLELVLPCCAKAGACACAGQMHAVVAVTTRRQRCTIDDVNAREEGNRRHREE